MEFPEENEPLFVYTFEKVHINNGKDFASGLNIQTYGHIQDVFDDRFKLYVCGANDDELLVEMPKIPYSILKEAKEQKKAYRQCGAFDKEIYDHESMAKTAMLFDKTRHQRFFHLKFNSGEGGALRELKVTSGAEADCNVISYTVTHKPGKKEFPVTTTLIKWELVFSDSVEPIKQPTIFKESKGKSKFEEMEEGMDSLVIAESQSEG